MKYIFIRPIVVCCWVGKYVLGCTNSFSGLEENKCAYTCVCSFPLILMDTIKHISSLSLLLTLQLEPQQVRSLCHHRGPEAIEMCDRAKLSQPCSKKQTRWVSQNRGDVLVWLVLPAPTSVLFVCLVFLAQVGDIPREEQQEKKAQQTQCSLCFPEVSFS